MAQEKEKTSLLNKLYKYIPCKLRLEILTNYIFNEKTSVIFAIISIGGIIITSVIFIVFGSWEFSNKIDESKIGQFGDFIGGVIGTILSFVAAILYYLALKSQRKDILINQKSIELQTSALSKQIEEFEKQKEELELTRKVYEEQSATMLKQEQTMKIQQFESNFYSLLNVYISIKNELNRNSIEKDFFKEIYLKFILLGGGITSELQPCNCHSKLSDIYITIYHSNQGHLSHYFKTIYRLIKVVDENQTLNEMQKISYIKIIRPQLTDYEQLIMYYNYHSVYGEKSKNLIYKYNLLKHVKTVDKIDFNIKYPGKIKNNNIISFTNWLDKYLNKWINIACNIDQVLENNEEILDNPKCTIKIHNDEEFKLIITCFEKEKFSNDFNKLIYDIIYDKLFISQYNYTNNGIINNNTTPIDNDSSIFEYIINTAQVKKINIDKF